MLFNTLVFAKFFLLVFAVYHLVRVPKIQNIVLLLASVVFYGFWDWRFLPLLAVSALINFIAGLQVHGARQRSEAKAWLVGSIAANLAILGFFKYYGFFIPGLRSLLSGLGLHGSTTTLNVILPLGISFFTFQAMSYPIDIYRGMMKPTKNFIDFSLFTVFFPNLIAGPIERARNLLPQIESVRTITKAGLHTGVWLIFYGLFKKIVVADSLALVTEPLFKNPSAASGNELIVCLYLFTLQLYADFSGYSDMARGLAKTLGFEVMRNFSIPYFSRNIAELWQRWHISLTTWIKEYVYYPLGLARIAGKGIPSFLVIFLTWVLMGWWHGPSTKFVIWGVYHAILLILYSRLRPYLNWIRPKSGLTKKIWDVSSLLLTFHFFAFGLLFFSAKDMNQVSNIMTAWTYHFDVAALNTQLLSFFVILVLPVVLVEWAEWRSGREAAVLDWPWPLQAGLFYVIFYLIVFFGVFSAKQYYYFQF